jgi:hypothetical protein
VCKGTKVEKNRLSTMEECVGVRRGRQLIDESQGGSKAGVGKIRGLRGKWGQSYKGLVAK